MATAKKTTAKTAATKRASATAAIANKTTANKTTANKATAKKTAASPATARPAARSTFAAGAERAGGERAKRRSTPLLIASQSSPAASATTKAPDLKHRPSPKARPKATGKQRSLSGERAAVPVSRIAQKKTAAKRGVPRTSPRARRSADDRARADLRLATPTAEQSSSLDPTLTPSAASVPARLPAPGVEDLLKGLIGALRLAFQAAGITPEDIERRIAHLLAYLRRRAEGDYTVDEFGYDEHYFANMVLPLLRPLYKKWFRVEVRGIENIPDDGAALIVANHSGTIAIDSMMLQVAIHDEHRRHRVMRALGADLVFQTPLLGTFARRSGSTLATGADADRLFANGELVGVFPEGFKGVGKPFKERYKLQRFGRGGFVSAALKAEIPIIPCSIVGAEEIAPIIGNLPTIARLLGMPYLPITPTFPLLGPLGMIPLPSKWIIEFGTPIRTDTYGSAAAEDPMLVFDLTDQVRETIQQTLYALLMQRRSVFF